MDGFCDHVVRSLQGLDIFGLVKGAECRCGFSAINRTGWRGENVQEKNIWIDGFNPHKNDDFGDGLLLFSHH